MSRALVALDTLRQLTDGTPEDLAALLEEIVRAQPIAGPWREVRVHLLPTWSREVIVRTARGPQFSAVVESCASAWSARTQGMGLSERETSYGHPTPEAARAHCDERLRAAGWLLL